jgi:hypothetical protein
MLSNTDSTMCLAVRQRINQPDIAAKLFCILESAFNRCKVILDSSGLNEAIVMFHMQCGLRGFLLGFIIAYKEHFPEASDTECSVVSHVNLDCFKNDLQSIVMRYIDLYQHYDNVKDIIRTATYTLCDSFSIGFSAGWDKAKSLKRSIQ